MKRNINLLSIFNFLIGFTFFGPLAIIYFSKVAGSYTLGTSIFGIIMLSAAIFEIPTGILSDKIGRKQTVILGSGARVLGFICYAVGYSYLWLLVGAILEGISRSFYSGNNDALLYDTLADEKRESEFKEHLGKTSSHEFTAIAISAVIGGFIAQSSFSWVMWLAVGSQVLLLAVSYLFIEPKSRQTKSTNVFSHLKEAFGMFITNKKLRLISIASMLEFSISDLAYQFRGAFFATIWPIWAIGFASIISNVGASISFYFSGMILKKIKAETMTVIRSSFDKIISLISLVFPTIVSPALMSSTSLLYGVGLVAENHLKQREFSDHQRATMASLISLGRSFGLAFMTLILGQAADILGPRIALILMTLLGFSATFFYFAMYKLPHEGKSNI